MASTSKAQQKATAKYVKNNYDEIKVRVHKGKKEVIAQFAGRQGKSINSFVSEAIDQKIRSEQEGEHQ